MIRAPIRLSRPARLRRAAFRPALEGLEDRNLLSFTAPLSYPGGANFQALAVGDFNADGKPDLAGINTASNTLSILLGKGDGTFTSAGSYPAGPGASAVAVADFNHDGKLDLAVVSQNGVGIWLGNGNGTFRAVSGYAVGSNPDAVAIADFNGDGKPDLVVANRNSGSVSVYLGKGDGTFTPSGSFAAGAVPTGVAVGDFNGDGRADLAVTDLNPGGVGKVNILLGKGDGTFTAPAGFATAQGATAVAVADFNGDGKADLAVTNLDNNVSILLGNGDGTFTGAGDYQAGNHAVVAGDFSGDGKTDLAAVSDATGTVSLLAGNGDGTFQAPAALGATSPGAAAVAVGDFNGDHLTDLALGGGLLLDQAAAARLTVTAPGAVPTGIPFALTVTARDAQGNVIPGYTGTVSFTYTPSVVGSPTPGLPAQYTFTPADHGVHAFTGITLWATGAQTISVSDTANPSVTGAVLVTGTPGAPPPGSPPFAGPSYTIVGARPVSMAVADFNHDGRPDIVSANLGDLQNIPGSVSVLLNRGNGVFQNVSTFPVGSPSAPIAVAAGDFNGDGNPDLAVANYLSNSVSLLLGNGDGTFRPGTTLSPGLFPFAVAVGDFNGDGKADVAVSYAGSSQAQGAGNVAVYLGNGDGTFQPPLAAPVGAQPVALAVGDFNGDGKADLAVADAGGNTVSLLLGNGDGTFQPAANYAVAANPISLIATDLNGDGKKDLAVACASSSTVSVLLGNGDGTFQPAVNYGVPEDPEAINATDLNGDGRPDLVVTANFDNPMGTVSVLMGTGGGAFAPPVNYPVGPGAVPVVAAYFNGDGTPDLAVGVAGSSAAPQASVALLPNPGASQIQFAAARYTVMENAGTAVITLTRTGSAAGPASVHYATSPGSAGNSPDYVPASGVVVFNAGETTKTFTITLHDDTAVEGDETVNLTLSGASGATLAGGPTQAVLVLRDNDGRPSQRFVAQLYLDLLGRPADPKGLGAWASLVDRGVPRGQVVIAFENSIEYRGLVVQRIFATYLGRPADPAGLSAFVAYLGKGGTVEQVITAVVSSAEFSARSGGTAAGFLSALYLDLLGRPLDAGGAAAWGGQLGNGVSPAVVTRMLLGSREAEEALVQGFYQRYLRRSADPTGLKNFADALAHGVRDEQLISYLVGSDEYFSSI